MISIHDRIELRVCIANQSLKIINAVGGVLNEYPVSTALLGPSCMSESGGTPLGRHRIRLKIGQNAPINAVFIRRRWTGEVLDDALVKRYPARDFILSRILWLDGLEPGLNKGGPVDTLRRFVYIHGTDQIDLIGQPVSHGCIRMSNRDICSLFDEVAPGTLVNIVE
jgi:L,D-transpeptidase YbiS